MKYATIFCIQVNNVFKKTFSKRNVRCISTERKNIHYIMCHNPLFYIPLFLCFLACDNSLEKALDDAGENRKELEKVLDYFKNDPDSLKYEAAKFLIENMPSQYYKSGSTVDMMDSIFVKASGESHNNRTAFFKQSVSMIDLSLFEIDHDINVMKADYLIKAVNEACDAWNNSVWHGCYDKSLFFEYVLPYRLCHEPLSDWRASVNIEYPMLRQQLVLSRRGIQLEAEDAQCKECETEEYNGASNGLAVMSFNRKSSICYTIGSERQTRKRLILKYSTVAHNLTAVLRVNEMTIDTISLAPTRNIETFSEKWLNKAISLKKGKNTICISCFSDTMCVDYIQLGALEDFRHSDLRDFSANYYNIINKETKHCISFDTATISTNNVVYLKPYSSVDCTQLVRLDYSGYPLWRIGYHKRDSLDICLKIEFGTPHTLSSGTEVTAGEYSWKPFEQWLFIPISDKEYRIMNKHTGLFLDVQECSKTGSEVLIQNVYSRSDSQKWILQEQGSNMYADTFFGIRSPLSEAMRVFDIVHQFEYYINVCPFDTKGSSLFKAKSGKCADETSFTIFLCRYLGIPSAFDFTPHWGNRSGSHSWSVLIDKNGKSVPFYMGNFPGDTAHYFHSYIKPKVFRYRYSLNRQMEADMKNEKSVPDFFSDLHFTDVTNEYFPTVDVTRQVPEVFRNRNVAYICVFDNQDWVPVYYGVVHKGEVTFRSMGQGIVYMVGFYEDGAIVPFGYPFLIDRDGNVRDIVPDERKPIKMKLLRKYPFMGAQDFFNSRMNNGQFHGSSKRDFSDAVVLHTHKGITNGNWYDIHVTTDKKFKYLRYMGGKGSYCNINELEFYSSSGKKIEGKIIGTEGENLKKKENVFDGNILTGFGGISPDGNWVGLQLDKPMQVSRIRYIGRNDGNCVEVGDEYELYYWNSDNDWKLIGTQKATGNSLYFSNVPSGGLYLLRDLTKGVEERIFTYEDNKQIWW